MNLDAAIAYSERHAHQALLVWREGALVCERYAGGWHAAKPHALYSGTKSFWGVLAVAAQDDRVLDLDEPVARTISAWAGDARKAAVTLRQLLQLTSGIGFGGLGSAVPPYAKALAVELKNDPGTRFTYGGIPLQVFGAVLAEKLVRRGLTPHAYLRERVLNPIDLRIASWRELTDGTHPLPTGAFLTAMEWLKFGRLVLSSGWWDGAEIVRAESLTRCFAGSPANPRYGLGWWLSPLAQFPDIAYASGSGGQALYVIPQFEAVIVRFGSSSSYKHEPFLKMLLL